MKQAGRSSTVHGGGKRRAWGVGTARAKRRETAELVFTQRTMLTTQQARIGKAVPTAHFHTLRIAD